MSEKLCAICKRNPAREEGKPMCASCYRYWSKVYDWQNESEKDGMVCPYCDYEFEEYKLPVSSGLIEDEYNRVVESQKISIDEVNEIEKLKNGETLDIRKIPAVIGGDEAQRKGIVLAKSDIAKQFGIVTGEPLYFARKKCPKLQVFTTDFSVYRNYSDKLYKLLLEYTDKKIKKI